MQKTIFHQHLGHKSSLCERWLVFFDAPKSRPSLESASENESAFEQSLQNLSPEVKESLIKKLTSITERDTFNRGNYKKPFYTRIIQEVLVVLGHNLDYVDSKGGNRNGMRAIDGLYGNNTRDAVSNLQRDLNSSRQSNAASISTDGIFGDGTAAVLIERLQNPVDFEDELMTAKRKLRLKIMTKEGQPTKDFLAFVNNVQQVHGDKLAEDVKQVWNNGYDLRWVPEFKDFFSHATQAGEGHVFTRYGNDIFFGIARNVKERFFTNCLLRKLGDAEGLFISPRNSPKEIIPIAKTEVPGIYFEKDGEGRLFDQAGYIATSDIDGLYRFSEGEHLNTYYVFSNGRLIDGGAYPSDYDPDKHYP